MNARIQDVLPLSPGQGGMLLHSLETAGSGNYVVQVVLDIRGTPDNAREAQAWADLVARHDALRTAFVWKGRKSPLQVVGHKARIRCETTDLSALDGAGQDRAFSNWLAEDRAQGFDLSAAPLIRVMRFDLGGERHRTVATFHHIALDGWSVPVLLRDWIALYAGRDLPPAPPVKDHANWLHRQDRHGALAFWQAELGGAGWQGELPLSAPDSRPDTARGDLSVTAPDLTDAARAKGLTPATLIHGAWALVLSAATGFDEVAYGLARAGRPAALAGSGGRVGMFLNTLPMRARVDRDRPLATWLSALQSAQAAQAPHEHVSLTDIRRTIPRRAGRPLFDSAVVVENYPTDPALLGQVPGLEITGVEIFEQTNLPLTLFATVKDGLTLRLLFDATRVDQRTARRLLGDVARTLSAFAATPDAPISALTFDSRGIARRAPEPVAAPAAAPPAESVEKLGGIWFDLLECPAPGAGDNFFDLGGHSLLVITLQERIEAAFAIRPEIPDLFRHATLGAQAAHLARLASGGDSPSDTVAERADARQAGRDRLRNRAARTRGRTTERRENA